MIVDRLGMLTKLYQLASVAIVCGSFIERIGGHNILEPACVGVSVIVGPYMHSQPMLYESAKNADALIQVTYDGVADAVTQLLSDEGVRRESSARALLWAETLRGATDRTVELLEQRVLSKIPVLH
jgi:3-deoxy-D-manno-octulosonic-acid transferase